MNIDQRIKALEDKSESFSRMLGCCVLCPRKCKVNRLRGEKGYCGIADEIRVFTAFCHMGEEPALSGTHGSGTIFFSGCSLKCIFCQNHAFSHMREGRIISPQELSRVMVNLQNRGAHNINLVTPTHMLPGIMKAVILALRQGLIIPIVYNTSGYENTEIISNIVDLVDVYLPDMKYLTQECASFFSNARDYPESNRTSIQEMCRQKKQLWNAGLLSQGLIVRHLVIPGHIEESIRILSWLKENIPHALVSVMFQYQPYHEAKKITGIDRGINHDEYRQVKKHLEYLDLEGWVQDMKPAEELAGVYFNDQLDKYLL